MRSTLSQFASKNRRLLITVSVAATMFAAISQFVSPVPVQGFLSPNVVISQIYGGGGNSGEPQQPRERDVWRPS